MRYLLALALSSLLGCAHQPAPTGDEDLVVIVPCYTDEECEEKNPTLAPTDRPFVEDGTVPFRDYYPKPSTENDQ